MRKVIVTGSDGFIGRVLADRLRRLGYDVICIDCNAGDNIREVSDAIRAGGTEHVFHLAAWTSFGHVCDYCKMYGVKLVYASAPTAKPGNTTRMNGLSQNFAEQYAKFYNREATGVRLHNVYGPNPRQGTLLHALLSQENATLYNNGANVRCFTYVDDIVDGLIHAAGSGEPLLNCVNDEPMTTLDFARKVQHLQTAHSMRAVKLWLTSDVRKHDSPGLVVDKDIPTIRLKYKSVDEGLKLCFNGYKVQDCPHGRVGRGVRGAHQEAGMPKV